MGEGEKGVGFLSWGKDGGCCVVAAEGGCSAACSGEGKWRSVKAGVGR